MDRLRRQAIDPDPVIARLARHASRRDWLYRSPEFKGVPMVQPAEWIDFSVADEVLSRIGIDPSGDEPVR